MKQQTYAVDIRINRFMKQKMDQFPELKMVTKPRVDEQREHLWSNFMGMVMKKQGVN